MPLGNTALAHVSVSGADAIWNLVSGSAPVALRIAQELETRGLNVLSAQTSQGLAGLSNYGFVYEADLGNDDPSKQWSVNLIRDVVQGAVEAATTYPATCSVTSSNIPLVSDTTFVPTVGGALPGGVGASGTDTTQKLDTYRIPILSDLIDSASGIAKDVGQTGHLILLAVGLLVVGGVLFVLIRPGEAAGAVRSVVRR